MTSGGGTVGKDSVILRGMSLGVWPCSSEYMSNTNWSGVSFFCFCTGGHKDRRMDLGIMGGECDWDALYKILK